MITAVTGLFGACYASGAFSDLFAASATPTVASPLVTDTPQPVEAATVAVTLAAPSPSTSTNLAVPAVDSGCPHDDRMGWLQYRDTWYGPWDGYWIRYDVNYFYVYDPNLWNAVVGSYGLETPYSTQFTRNAWTELIDSPFWVCIDIPGNVYVVYQQ